MEWKCSNYSTSLGVWKEDGVIAAGRPLCDDGALDVGKQIGVNPLTIVDKVICGTFFMV